jgi:hypothetical protein
MTDDFIRQLRSGREWLNDGRCCGQVCSDGVCCAPACVFGEALEYFYKAADKLEQLEKYKKLVEFIANDYHELSHDKAQWQRDDWKKRCKQLIETVDE